jgi:hypothetical protein
METDAISMASVVVVKKLGEFYSTSFGVDGVAMVVTH